MCSQVGYIKSLKDGASYRNHTEFYRNIFCCSSPAGQIFWDKRKIHLWSKEKRLNLIISTFITADSLNLESKYNFYLIIYLINKILIWIVFFQSSLMVMNQQICVLDENRYVNRPANIWRQDKKQGRLLLLKPKRWWS